MECGVNVARITDWTFSVYQNSNSKDEHKCVFISHKKEDASAAVAVGEYLMSKGINVYLDQDDETLQAATQEENDLQIVNSIKRGLSVSTHLLCLISDKTQLSWWVPYEIGIAENAEINIASLKLKVIDSLPSFLKIQPVLYNIEDFINYSRKLERYGGIFSKDSPIKIREEDKALLGPYLD